MPFNNDDPEAEKRRLAALAEQERMEEWREQVRKANERVLQLIQQKFETVTTKILRRTRKGKPKWKSNRVLKDRQQRC